MVATTPDRDWLRQTCSGSALAVSPLANVRPVFYPPETSDRASHCSLSVTGEPTNASRGLSGISLPPFGAVSGIAPDRAIKSVALSEQSHYYPYSSL